MIPMRTCRAAGIDSGHSTKHPTPQPTHMVNAEQQDSLMVFLVEDSIAIRARLAATIRGIEGAELVGEAGTVGGAIDGIRATHPRALILDLQLEDGSGLEVLKAVRSASPALHVAVLTNYATDQHRRACVDAGAEYFLDKSSDFPRIREIVQEWTHGPRGATES